MIGLLSSGCCVQYKTERDGVIETRIEKRVIVTGDAQDIDHDKVRLLIYS